MHYQQFRQASQLCLCFLVTYFWKRVDVFDLDYGGLGPALPGFLFCPSPVMFSIMKNYRGYCRATYRGCGSPKFCWLLTELSHWRPWWEPGGGRLGEAGVISLLLLPWVDALAAGEFFLWLQLPLYRLSMVPALLAHGLSWVPAVLPLVFVLQPKGGIGFLLLLISGSCHHFLFDSQLFHHLSNPFCTLNPFCLLSTCSGMSSTSLFCEEEFGAQRG